MTLATRTFAPDLVARAYDHGPEHFAGLVVGDSNDTRVVCVRRVPNAASEASSLLAALDEATVRRLLSERRAALEKWEREAYTARLADADEPAFPALAEWPVAP